MKGTAKSLTLAETKEVDTYEEAATLVKAAELSGKFATQHCQYRDYTKPGAFVVKTYNY